MGVYGLRKYVEGHRVTRVIKDPVEGVSHLCLDMNGLLHTVYNKQAATEKAVLDSLVKLVDKMIELFAPSKSLCVAFDGPAPVSKLKTQRERRKAMVGQQSKSMELNEAQIVTGHPIILHAEQVLESHLLACDAAGTLPAVLRLSVSGCTVPGEGEAKIMQHLTAEARNVESYEPDDAIVVIGNDSDLVLNCIATTPYHNLFVVNPYSLIMTCVGDLLWHWCKQGSGISASFLPQVRRDFVFITLLAGGDHYPGIEDEVANIWRRYREMRAAGQFKGRGLVGEDYRLDGEVLANILRKDRHGNGSKQSSYGGGKKIKKRQEIQREMAMHSGSVDDGLKLLGCVLWAHSTTSEGICPDFHMIHKGSGVKPGALRNAAQHIQHSQNSRLKLPMSATPPLKPLQVYTAVITNPHYLPSQVTDVMNDDPDLKKLCTTGSIPHMLSLVDSVFNAIDPGAWSEEEKVLLSFTEAKLFSRSSSGSKLAPGTVPKPASGGDAPLTMMNFACPRDLEHLNFITFGSKKVNALVIPKAWREGAPDAAAKPAYKDPVGAIMSAVSSVAGMVGLGKKEEAVEASEAAVAEEVTDDDE